MRECGECSLCCRLSVIPALEKPMNRWCKHAKPGHGCTIHETRPQVCRSFFCLWALGELPDEWFPKKCRMYLSQKPGGTLEVMVDPERPNQWRKEPFFSVLKRYANNAGALSVAVIVGRNVYQIASGELVIESSAERLLTQLSVKSLDCCSGMNSCTNGTVNRSRFVLVRRLAFRSRWQSATSRSMAARGRLRAQADRQLASPSTCSWQGASPSRSALGTISTVRQMTCACWL